MYQAGRSEEREREKYQRKDGSDKEEEMLN